MTAFVVAMLLAQPPQTVEPPVADITGHYLCRGKEPSGKTYEASCLMVRKGGVYLVSWAFPGQAIVGIGVRQGESLSVSWSQPGGAMGVNVYRIRSDRRLVGRWASLPGSGSLGDETLTFAREYTHEEPYEP